MNSARRIEVTARTAIKARPQCVFEWISDPERVPLWIKDLVESRPDSVHKPLEQGARSIEVLQVGRSQLEVPAEVTAVEVNRLAENRLDLPEGPCTSRVTIIETSTGCIVTQTMTAAFTSMRWVPSVILAKMLSHRLRGDLHRLKTLIESR